MTGPAAAWTGALIAPPLSGSIKEAHFAFGAPGGPWSWARFEESLGPGLWAGCFQCGDRAFDWVGVVADSSDALVVAAGEGYWVSLQERVVRYRENSIVAAATVPDIARVLVASDQDVALLSPEGVAWRTDDVASDGIRFTKITKHLACGEAYARGSWVPFEIDIDTGGERGGPRWY